MPIPPESWYPRSDFGPEEPVTLFLRSLPLDIKLRRWRRYQILDFPVDLAIYYERLEQGHFFLYTQRDFQFISARCQVQGRVNQSASFITALTPLQESSGIVVLRCFPRVV